MVGIFIDASVLADWMILKLDYNSKGKDLQVIENYKETNKRVYCSYKIIESLRKGLKGYEFHISDLSMMEVTSVIFEKYVMQEMASKSISLNYFWRYRDKFQLPKEVYRIIHHEIYNFYKLFINKGRIKLSNDIKFNVCKYLICYYNVRTHDSFLISQANYQGCSYFLTNDSVLKDLVKAYRKITIIRPEALCIQLKIK